MLHPALVEKADENSGGEDEAQITNGRITAAIDRYGWLEFTNSRGDLLLRDSGEVDAVL